MTGTREANQGRASAAAKPLRVGDQLVGAGLITQEQLDKGLAQQKELGFQKLLGEVLVELKFVTEEQVLETLANASGVPFVRLSSRLADPGVIEKLPREFIEKHHVLPLFLVGGKLTVAVVELSNVFLFEEIQKVAGCPVQIVATTTGDLRSTYQALVPQQGQTFVIDDLVGDIQEDTLTVVEQTIADLGQIGEADAGTSPVIRLVNYIIYCAVQEKASDIHIEPSEKTLRVRYRVDGNLYEKMKPPHQMTPAVVSRIKIMASMDISERRVPQDGGITVMVNKRPIDLRVSTMPAKFGEKVVMRVIDNRGTQVTLEQLGFSFEMLAKWRQVVRSPNGIVLVTGPTGSGKSTTLYATLAEVSDESSNVSTVEDPVEYQLAGVNQFQTNDKAGFTFAGALRALLRQDPDVIMVGEVRDLETARIATQAALTGHLVVSTLHTNDAPSAVTRLFNIGVEPYLVAASLKGVLAQRLLRKICAHCKEPTELEPNLRRALAQLPGGEAMSAVFKGAGCPRCRKTGYSGRIGVYELFAPNDELMESVSRGATLQEIRKLALGSGTYTTLAQDGLEKVRAGVTTVEELFTAVAA